jgi:hypothetical protein
MNTEPDISDQTAQPTPVRLVVGGVSAVMAVAIAIGAVLGTWSGAMASGDRYAEGLMARCVAVAIVRGMERAREQEKPAAAAVSREWRGSRVENGDECFAQVLGGVSLARLGVGQVDLPPPCVG